MGLQDNDLQTKSIAEDAATASWCGCAQIGTTITTPTVPSLKRYGYPPDKQENATQIILAQAEVLSEGWAA